MKGSGLITQQNVYITNHNFSKGAATYSGTTNPNPNPNPNPTAGTISAAVFTAPTALGQITISGIVGTYDSFDVTRNGVQIATSQTGATFTDTGLADNTQYTYTLVPSYGGTPFTAIVNPKNGATPGKIYTLASAPTLVYNGSGSSASAISFSWSGGAYTNLSIQYPSGTFITTKTTSPYTGGSYGPNVQSTYYVFAINGDGYGGLTAAGTGTNVTASSTSVAVCTWASANTPSFSSTSTSATTLACTGTFTNAYVTYSPTSGSPTSGTQFSTANSITSTYTSVTAGTTYTFNVYPVNSLNYPASATGTNYSTSTVAIPGNPVITSASFSSPTALNQIVIGAIAGTYTTFNVSRNGTTIATGQTGATYTDTGLANNTQYTYTIVPINGGTTGPEFTAIVNPNNGATPGKIYTLATVTGLNPTYSGASSTVSSVYITWTITGYTSLYLSNTTKGGGNYAASGSAYDSSTGRSSDSSLTANTQYSYKFSCRNGDGYYAANSLCQTTVNTCTWASAPTLTYNGAGSSTSQISFSWSGGAYTNLSIQYPNGTQVTTTTTSPYKGGSFSANQKNTYYVYPINALSYMSSNGSNVQVCTWGTCNAPTFSSTTTTGTTLANSGTFSQVYITFSGGAASPGSGTTVAGTNAITKAYSSMASGTAYTFNCYPVNALSYQSSNNASANVTTISSVASLTGSYSTTSVSGYATAYKFTGNGSFSLPSTKTAAVLVVGGGGGGGGAKVGGQNEGGGGGGAGGLLYGTYTFTGNTSYSVTIGQGGAGGSSSGTNGAQGGNTIIGSNLIVAPGGGYGTYVGNAGSGGSGGGTGRVGSGGSGGSGFITGGLTSKGNSGRGIGTGSSGGGGGGANAAALYSTGGDG